MVAAQKEPQMCQTLLGQLMVLPNNSWRHVMQMAANNVESLQDIAAVKEVAQILRTQIKVCSSVGMPYASQMGSIYLDMLNVYKAYSEYISRSIQQHGDALGTGFVVSQGQDC